MFKNRHHYAFLIEKYFPFAIANLYLKILAICFKHKPRILHINLRLHY